jgi:hypothetical protein
MRLLLIIALIIPQFCIGQTKEDYQIYSKVINEQIDNWKIQKEKIANVVISNALTKNDMIGELKSKIDIIYGKDKQMEYIELNYDTFKIKLFENREVKKALFDLVNKLDIPTNLNSIDFNLFCHVEIVKKEWLEKMFKSNGEWRRVDRAWSKFYKKYPKSPGYFGFSQISYSGGFATLYKVHNVRPLMGGGTLVLLIRKNGEWEILTEVNVWYT